MNSVLPNGQSSAVVFEQDGVVGVVGRRMGYVGVPRSHLWSGVVDDDGRNSDELPFPDVHGGVTWAGPVPSSVPAAYAGRDLYWVGWDYNHFCGDNDMRLGLSYGVRPTYAMLRDEVVRVCQVATQ